MEYKIGEIAQLMGMSKEMIRYYERKGALSPKRQTNNNYRTYSMMDVFMLLEILHYQSYSVEVREIVEMIQDDYLNRYQHILKQKYTDLNGQIRRNIMMQRFCREATDELETCQLNQHNFWIRKIPSARMFFLCNGDGDEYGKLEMDDLTRHFLLSEDVLPFIKNYVCFEKDHETWWSVLNDEYASGIEIPLQVKSRYREDSICLCTISDIGNVGSFSRKCLEPSFRYIEEHSLKAAGVPMGRIIGRGNQNGTFHRWLELEIPVQPEEV
jgi:DNA-binding transcriptional MerR regulator